MAFYLQSPRVRKVDGFFPLGRKVSFYQILFEFHLPIVFRVCHNNILDLDEYLDSTYNIPEYRVVVYDSYTSKIFVDHGKPTFLDSTKRTPEF